MIELKCEICGIEDEAVFKCSKCKRWACWKCIIDIDNSRICKDCLYGVRMDENVLAKKMGTGLVEQVN